MTLLAIYIYLMSGHEIGAPQSRELRSPKEWGIIYITPLTLARESSTFLVSELRRWK